MQQLLPQLDDAPLLEALRSDMAPALADLDAEAGFQTSSSSNGGGGFGPLTAGRLLPLKLLQLLVPALRYSERCGDAEALLKAIAAENKDAAVFCASETAKMDALRQGKDSGDAAFKRGKVRCLVSLPSTRSCLLLRASCFFYFFGRVFSQRHFPVFYYCVCNTCIYACLSFCPQFPFFPLIQYHAAVALYTEALGIDALADAVNSVLYCNRAASHMALGKHDAAVRVRLTKRRTGYSKDL